ncbi:glycosyltransferase family 4 protein [uncultured Paludibaculum sp.]|uniref:glycosyltransferase family 4 protein n=1 Tax=uncultured Paludibaculum sp. TaxID=1765020 RepID=UPI00374DBF77
MGFTVHAVASPGAYGDGLSREIGVSFHPVAMSRSISPLQDLRSLWHLCRVIRNLKPSIVHSHTPKAGLLGMIAAALCGVRARMFHVHGAPHLAAGGFRRILLKASTAISCRLARRVLCVSHSVKSAIVRDGTCDADKVHVPVNGSSSGVDTEGAYSPDLVPPSVRHMFLQRHRLPADALVVGFVGRIVRDKGLVELATAWKKIRDRYPLLYLAVAGEVEPQDPVPAEIIAMLAEDSRVRLLGWIDDMRSFYASSDILVLPSYREGFPNCSLEASAMEVPVVSTLVPGCVDAVVNGTTGLLVPPRDADALGAAIERYVMDPKLRHLHGRAGRLRVIREFQPLPIFQDVYRHYCELLAECGLRVPMTTAAGPPTLADSSCQDSAAIR